MSDPSFLVEDLLALLPPIPADSIVSRAIHSGAGVRATLFGFAPGQELTEHSASHAAVLHVLRGRADLTLGERKAHAGPGTWAHMPAHLPHSIRATEELVMLLLLLEQA
jgi:quercetin dioxygenase-like cupin family protein